MTRALLLTVLVLATVVALVGPVVAELLAQAQRAGL